MSERFALFGEQHGRERSNVRELLARAEQERISEREVTAYEQNKGKLFVRRSARERTSDREGKTACESSTRESE